MNFICLFYIVKSEMFFLHEIFSVWNNSIDSPAMNIDACVIRLLVLHLMQWVIVNRLSSSQFHVYWLKNWNSMMAMMYSEAMVAIEIHHHLIVTFPVNIIIKYENHNRFTKKKTVYDLNVHHFIISINAITIIYC